MLGELQDPRAIEPLLAALRSICGGSSSRRLLPGTLATAVVAVVLTAIAPWVAFNRIPGHLGYPILVASGVLMYMADRLVSVGIQGRAIGRALQQLTVACPAPSLREALPALESIAANRVAYSATLRREVREAAIAIEEATAELQQLPIPSTPADPGHEDLPRPSAAGDFR